MSKLKALIKLAEKYNILFSLAEDNKVVSLEKFKKNKTDKENKDYYNSMMWMMDLMDPNVLFSEKSSINIDDMYQARKAVGFPKPKDGAPAWLIVMLSCIDEENPIKRKALYTKFIHSPFISKRFSKDKKEAEKAEEEYKKDLMEEEKNFVNVAKKGWIKIENISDWYDNYPLLFGNFNTENIDKLKNTWFEFARDYLFEKNKIKKGIDLYKSILDNTVDLKTLPVGTVIYATDLFNKKLKQNIKFLKKISKDDKYNSNWISDQNERFNEVFLNDKLKYQYKDIAPILLFDHPSFFNYNDYSPSNEELIITINKFLKEKPEELLLTYSEKGKYLAREEHDEDDYFRF